MASLCTTATWNVFNFLDIYPIVREWVVTTERTLVVGSGRGAIPSLLFLFLFFVYIFEMDNGAKMELSFLVVVMEGHSNNTGFALHRATKTKRNSRWSTVPKLLESHSSTSTKTKVPSRYNNLFLTYKISGRKTKDDQWCLDRLKAISLPPLTTKIPSLQDNLFLIYAIRQKKKTFQMTIGQSLGIFKLRAQGDF